MAGKSWNMPSFKHVIVYLITDFSFPISSESFLTYIVPIKFVDKCLKKGLIKVPDFPEVVKYSQIVSPKKSVRSFHSKSEYITILISFKNENQKWFPGLCFVFSCTSQHHWAVPLQGCLYPANIDQLFFLIITSAWYFLSLTQFLLNYYRSFSVRLVSIIIFFTLCSNTNCQNKGIVPFGGA